MAYYIHHLFSSIHDSPFGMLHVDINGSKIAFYNYKPIHTPKRTVFLLHGMKFSKETWKTLGTLELLREQGNKGDIGSLCNSHRSVDKFVPVISGNQHNNNG